MPFLAPGFLSRLQHCGLLQILTLLICILLLVERVASCPRGLEVCRSQPLQLLVRLRRDCGSALQQKLHQTSRLVDVLLSGVIGYMVDLPCTADVAPASTASSASSKSGEQRRASPEPAEKDAPHSSFQGAGPLRCGSLEHI